MILSEDLIIPITQWNLQTADEKQKFLVDNKIFLNNFIYENVKNKSVTVAIKFERYSKDLLIKQTM